MPNRRTILVFIVVPLSLMLALAVCGYIYLRNANLYSALEATREWARLNEFPATASAISVETKGNLFTREFTVTFVAPLEDINTWLHKSAGTKDVTPTVMGSVRRYELESSGTAQHAELEVDERTRKVKIKTFWS